MAVRCPLGCHPELGGLWIPAFAGKTMRELSARLGPPRFSDSSALSLLSPRERVGRGRGGAAATGLDLSAVDIPPARCLGAREKTAPSVLRRPWRFDALLVAVQSSVVLGSRRSPGRR